MLANSRLLSASLLLFLLPNWAPAGLHLGMKLACKRYGDAWTAGDKNALIDAVTPEFAAVWQRMPDSMFAKLPKARVGDTFVLDSRKSRDEANVSVQTSDGIVTFLLDGAGFQWKVADLMVLNEFGDKVSLKQSLAASMSARQFMIGLADSTGRTWGRSLSNNFRRALLSLVDEDWQRVRGYLPALNDPEPQSKPSVRFFGNTAKLITRLPGGDPNARVSLSLVFDRDWQVDDLEINSASLKIQSFRESLRCLVTVAMLGEFMKNPQQLSPAQFVANGNLRREFEAAHAGKATLPASGNQTIEHLRIRDSMHVFIKYPDRWVLVLTKPSQTERNLIVGLQIHQGGTWQDVADLLALQRTIKSNPLGKLFGQVSANTNKSQQLD